MLKRHEVLLISSSLEHFCNEEEYAIKSAQTKKSAWPIKVGSTFQFGKYAALPYFLNCHCTRGITIKLQHTIYLGHPWNCYRASMKITYIGNPLLLLTWWQFPVFEMRFFLNKFTTLRALIKHMPSKCLWKHVLEPFLSFSFSINFTSKIRSRSRKCLLLIYLGTIFADTYIA